METTDESQLTGRARANRDGMARSYASPSEGNVFVEEAAVTASIGRWYLSMRTVRSSRSTGAGPTNEERRVWSPGDGQRAADAPSGCVPHRRPQLLGELDATPEERHTFDPAGTWK